MATRRQIAANRKNSLHATGPKSNCGKARAAKNAVRHGLTSPPSPDLIRKHFDILTASYACLKGRKRPESLVQSAWILATAEAHAQDVRNQMQLRRVELCAADKDFSRDKLGVNALKRMADARYWINDPLLRRAFKAFSRRYESDLFEMRDGIRIVLRYLAEAEAKARKARAAFFEAMEKSRNEANNNL